MGARTPKKNIKRLNFSRLKPNKQKKNQTELKVKKAVMKIFTLILTLIGSVASLAETSVIGNQIQHFNLQQRKRNRDLLHRALLKVYSLPPQSRSEALAELEDFLARLKRQQKAAEAEKEQRREEQRANRRSRFQSHHHSSDY